MSIGNYHNAYFFCGQNIFLDGQFWAMGSFTSLGGQNDLLGGQLPTQLTRFFTSLTLITMAFKNRQLTF